MKFNFCFKLTNVFNSCLKIGFGVAEAGHRV